MPFEEVVMTKEQRRELRVRFASNTPGGDFQAGQVLAHIETSDRRVLT